MKTAYLRAFLRFFLLLLAAALLLTTASPWAVFCLCLLLSLPALSVLSLLLERKNLSVSVSLGTAASKNSATEGRIIIKNSGYLPVSRIDCLVQSENDLTSDGTQLALSLSVGARSSASAVFLLQSEYCGRLQVYLKQAVLTDVMGFLHLPARLNASARITILPDTFPVDVSLHSFAPLPEEDSAAQQRGEDRSEVFQLREYLPGDNVKDIHWKLSSKWDQLILREPSRMESRSLLLVWDKRPEAAPAVMDALAEAVASVGQAMAERGYRFHLEFSEGDEMQITAIDSAEDMLQQIPNLLRSGKEQSASVLPDLETYGCILYFSAAPPDLQSERLIAFVCGETDSPDAICFTPETCQEMLVRLEI